MVARVRRRAAAYRAASRPPAAAMCYAPAGSTVEPQPPDHSSLTDHCLAPAKVDVAEAPALIEVALEPQRDRLPMDLAVIRFR